MPLFPDNPDSLPSVHVLPMLHVCFIASDLTRDVS